MLVLSEGLVPLMLPKAGGEALRPCELARGGEGRALPTFSRHLHVAGCCSPSRSCSQAPPIPAEDPRRAKTRLEHPKGWCRCCCRGPVNHACTAAVGRCLKALAPHGPTGATTRQWAPRGATTRHLHVADNHNPSRNCSRTSPYRTSRRTPDPDPSRTHSDEAKREPSPRRRGHHLHELLHK